ncbi:uncharacterized protein A1O9_00365 [Exophiala aquamarina CBS 119918]|uniref:DUF7791 domain-containing protein n=1 Tax=Exophiala aquamarina CBS 119918 TaxID=1182545 RepID=A0A072PST4_9EURO|nr:uncharacterized protein A1O9_00365 [Exophiala aquamarina CBS 119918]KEF62393.1 hypothetical protein A1O9_00365 [Exophiala aquamarina CBS 119918]
MKYETKPLRKVLDSLYCAQMDERRNRVNRPHSQTFQWIFCPKAEDDTFRDDFVDWLCSPTTRAVYWIRGKAGCGSLHLYVNLTRKFQKSSTTSTTRPGNVKLYTSRPICGTLAYKGRLQSIRPRPAIGQQSVPGATTALPEPPDKYIARNHSQKADGVFLWVRLVVRELLKRVRDGESASELLDQLHAIPPDLDNCFMRMMETIEPRYRQAASTMLQIAFCRMDFTLDQPSLNVRPTAGPALLLLHLQYLDEVDAPNFVNCPDFRPLMYDDEDEVSYWVETLDRRLTSGCMGLLEAGKILPGQSLWEIKVDFLDQTARDFMCTREAQSIFHRYTDGPCDAHMYHCNFLVADIMSLHQLPSS